MASEFSVASTIVSCNRKKAVVELRRRHDSKVCSLLNKDMPVLIPVLGIVLGLSKGKHL